MRLVRVPKAANIRLSMKTSFSKHGGFSILKFLLGLVLFLVVAVLLFVTFLLSPTAKWAANSQLPGILGTDASVEDVSIDLWNGTIAVSGVRVANPTKDPGQPDLFLLDSLNIDLVPASFFGDTIHVREVRIVGPAAHVRRLADGSFSFEKLKILQDSSAGETPPPSPEEAGGPGKAIQIDLVSLEGLAGSFLDEGTPGQTVSYSIEDFNFLAEGITANPGSAVASLPPGVDLALVRLSDARFDYHVAGSPEKKEEAPQGAESPQAGSQAAPAPEPEKEPAEAEPVYLGTFEIGNFAFRYRDEPTDGEPVDIQVEKFRIRAEDIAFDPAGLLKEAKDKILTAELGFEIPQKEEGVGPAAFAGVAKSGVIGDGIPVTAGQVQLTGFELATLGPLVPQGTQSAIGGPGFDLTARWFVSPDKLDGKAVIVSSKGTTTSVTVGGTPDNPKISGSELLLNLVGRPGQFLQTVAGDAIQGSVEIVSGAADAAGKLAKGAGDTVLGFGKGLLRTGGGLLTGNLKEAGKGLEEATVGTVKQAGSAVAESTDAAASGVKGAVDAGTGGKRQASWRTDSAKRHEAFEAAAREWLEKGNFPPESLGDEKAGGSAAEPPVSNQRGDDDARKAAEAAGNR